MKQVVAYLDQGPEARGVALDIILQYTAHLEKRQLYEKMFLETQLMKTLLNMIVDPKITVKEQTTVFQILINMVQDKVYIKQCVDVGAARRVFDFLMNNVKQDAKDVGSSTKLI